MPALRVGGYVESRDFGTITLHAYDAQESPLGAAGSNGVEFSVLP